MIIFAKIKTILCFQHKIVFIFAKIIISRNGVMIIFAKIKTILCFQHKIV
jgi:hypothetical protein